MEELYPLKLDTPEKSENIYHVYPLSEESEHRLVGCDCQCNPTIELNEDGTIVIHNRKT